MNEEVFCDGCETTIEGAAHRINTPKMPRLQGVTQRFEMPDTSERFEVNALTICSECKRRIDEDGYWPTEWVLLRRQR